jgi:hypothetical protein
MTKAIRMIGFGLGLGTVLKTGVDLSGFDPSIFIPKSPQPAVIDIKMPDITMPAIIVNSSSTGGLITAPIISATIFAGGGGGGLLRAALLFTGQMGATFAWIKDKFSFFGNILKQLWPWNNQKAGEDAGNPNDAEEAVDVFEGCDPATQLTGVSLGTFTLLGIGKTISVWQVLLGDGTPIGVWLIENALEHAEEDLMPYTRFVSHIQGS